MASEIVGQFAIWHIVCNYFCETALLDRNVVKIRTIPLTIVLAVPVLASSHHNPAHPQQTPLSRQMTHGHSIALLWCH